SVEAIMLDLLAPAARRLGEMVDNLGAILGIELLAGAQGVEMRSPLKTSSRLATVIERLRMDVPSLGADRHMAPDIATATSLVRSTALTAAAGPDELPRLGV
ncbi:MAG: aromatic amino acid lyase, partial [Pseudomonadota bacterium]